jgi:predicted thioredoxin/glutaredoxin
MEIKIFIKSNCKNCPPAKELGKQLEEKKLNVRYYDIDNYGGLAESCLYSIMSTPAIVITKKEFLRDKEVKSWRSDVPSLDEVMEVVGLT